MRGTTITIIILWRCYHAVYIIIVSVILLRIVSDIMNHEVEGVQVLIASACGPGGL